MTHCRNNIGNYRTGSRQLTGSHAVKHGGSQAVSYDTNTVIHAIYRVKRILLLHHHGGYISKVLILHRLYGSQKLNAVSQCLGISHIDITDIPDSFRVNILVAATITGGHGKEDGSLSGGIKAVNIRRGISFRITQSLRFLQGVLKAGAFLPHLG